MLALPITIFIYQLVAVFGVAAITSVVIASSTLDFRLMYLQGPLDKVLHWTRFKSNIAAKGILIVLTLVTAVIMFLPTLLVYCTESMGYKGYYLTDIKQESDLDPSSNPNPIVLPTTVQEDYPPFDDFRVLYLDNASGIPEYHHRNWVNTESIVKTYLYKQLRVPVVENEGGVWYGVMTNLTDRPYTNEYGDTYRLYNIHQRQNEAPVPQRVDAATGTYYTDTNMPTYTFGAAADQDSFSLYACNGQLISNLSSIDNHQILAVSNASAGIQCYPQFDASLSVSVQEGGPSVKSSVLEDRYGVYRPARLDSVKKSTSAISVSAMKLNDTFITMAIKKQTHITYHGQVFDDKDKKELLNCSSANLDRIYLSQKSKEYNAYNHTSILCQLRQLSLQDPSFSALQAVRRSYGANAIIHSVYTYMAPTTDNPLGGFGVDLTYFTALTLKSDLFNLPKGEHLIAHSFNDPRIVTSASSVEALIDNVNVFSTDDMTDPTLPNLVKIQASLKSNHSFYYFSRWTAQVHFAYDMEADYSWKFLIGVVASLFFLAACSSCRHRKKTLRALIAACPTDERIDDTATLVAGQRKPPKSKAQESQKPTKFALAKSTSKSSYPVMTVDGKDILLE